MPETGEYIRTLVDAQSRTDAADRPAAADLWARVVDINPLIGRHWVQLAEARFDLGDYRGAAAAYTSAQDVGVSPHGEPTEAVFPAELAYRLATCHAGRGDHEAAVRELHRALDLGLRDLGRPQHDERWTPILNDAAVREMLGILDPTALTRDEGWRTDLTFLAREIKRRAYAPFRKISEPEFDAAVARLVEDVPDLSDYQILAGMMRLLRSLDDGHALVLPTESDEGEDEEDRAPCDLPLKFYRFDEGLFVVAASEPYREIVGAQVLSMDGHPADEALAALEPLISRGNDQQVMLMGPELLRWTPLVHAVGLIRDPRRVTLTVRLTDQKTRAVVIEPFAGPHQILTAPLPAQMVCLPDTVGTPVPLYLRNSHTPYWFEHLPQDGIVYFQFNAVRDQAPEPITAFCQRLFAFIDNHQVSKLIIDLRWNGGGNTALVAPLIHGLIRCTRINQRGRLYVIIGRGTFSAAQNTATMIERETQAIFAGEPTGSPPNHIGEIVPFTLFDHRYLPDGRATYGHPVLSMSQTDIICYGTDLVDYIHHEFGGPGDSAVKPLRTPQATVPFWRDFL